MRIALIIAALLLSAPAAAVKIAPLSSKELAERSAIILVGRIDAAKDNTGAGGEAARGKMYVSVSVGAVLKGKTSATAFTLALDYGSGVKSFDPKLAPGQTCVFFLRSIQEGEAVLAHWGSVAPFTADYLYKP